MPTSCLAVTGIDGTQSAIVAVLAAALIVAGVIALRRSKHAAMFVLAPLVILGLVLGTGAAPAQAYTAAYPSATLSEVWTLAEGTYASEVPADPDASNFGELFDDTEHVTDAVVMSFDGVAYEGAPFWVIDPTTYVISFGSEAIFLALADAEYGSGEDVTVTLTVTYDYADECDRPLQTVYTYTGTVSTPEVIG